MHQTCGPVVGHPERTMIELELSPEELAFRDEVRAFINEKLTPELRRETARTTTVFAEKDVAMEWQAILHERGWAAPSWPVEFGGPGWSSTQKFIFNEECTRAGAPGLIPLGLRMLAPVLFKYGTPEQQAEYLPKMLTGEHYWCQGYSEPGSGSDLASLKTRAERDGDDYLVNGTKIWTTHAQFADHIFCLVKTKPDGKPQAGISFLLIDMATPGITVEPIITMAGDHEVNQVFFDNVRVPIANRLGAENDGWAVAKYLLEYERGGGAAATRSFVGLESLDNLLANEQYFDDDIATRRNEVEIEMHALQVMETQLQARLAKGDNPGPESSLMKNFSVSIGQRLSTLKLEALGYHAVPHNTLLDLQDKECVGPAETHTPVGVYLNNRASSIFGGSEQVQKNIIAKVVLGL